MQLDGASEERGPKVSIISRRETEPLLLKTRAMLECYARAAGCGVAAIDAAGDIAAAAESPETVAVRLSGLLTSQSALCAYCARVRGPASVAAGGAGGVTAAGAAAGAGAGRLCPCLAVHRQSLRKARPAGSAYAYLCDLGLGFWTSPVYVGGRYVGALVAGQVLAAGRAAAAARLRAAAAGVAGGGMAVAGAAVAGGGAAVAGGGAAVDGVADGGVAGGGAAVDGVAVADAVGGGAAVDGAAGGGVTVDGVAVDGAAGGGVAVDGAADGGAAVDDVGGGGAAVDGAVGVTVSTDAITAALDQTPARTPAEVEGLARMLLVCAGRIGDGSEDSLTSVSRFARQESSLAMRWGMLRDGRRERDRGAAGGGAVAASPAYPLDRERALLASLRRGDGETARQVLAGILDVIQAAAPGNLDFTRFRAMELVALLSRAAPPEEGGENAAMEANNRRFQRIHDAATVEELSAHLRLIVDQLSPRLFTFQGLRHASALRKAERYIWKRYTHKVSLADIAAAAGLSPSYFSSVFKEEMRENLSSYLNRLRVEKAAVMLIETSLPLNRIAAFCGFEDQSWFSKIFKAYAGLSPGKFRENGDGVFAESGKIRQLAALKAAAATAADAATADAAATAGVAGTADAGAATAAAATTADAATTDADAAGAGAAAAGDVAGTAAADAATADAAATGAGAVTATDDAATAGAATTGAGAASNKGAV